jgi:hypothetical protein
VFALENTYTTLLDFGGINSGDAEGAIKRADKGGMVSAKQLRGLVTLLEGKQCAGCCCFPSTEHLVASAAAVQTQQQPPTAQQQPETKAAEASAAGSTGSGVDGGRSVSSKSLWGLGQACGRQYTEQQYTYMGHFGSAQA